MPERRSNHQRIGKVRKSGLPPPFNLLQAVNLDEEAGIRAVVKERSRTFQVDAEARDVTAMLNELIRLDVRAEK